MAFTGCSKDSTNPEIEKPGTVTMTVIASDKIENAPLTRTHYDEITQKIQWDGDGSTEFIQFLEQDNAAATPALQAAESTSCTLTAGKASFTVTLKENPFDHPDLRRRISRRQLRDRQSEPLQSQGQPPGNPDSDRHQFRPQCRPDGGTCGTNDLPAKNGANLIELRSRGGSWQNDDHQPRTCCGRNSQKRQFRLPAKSLQVAVMSTSLRAASLKSAISAPRIGS